MDEKMIPYIAHESMLSRQERTIRRLWILCLLLTVLLVATNGAWIWYESQFEDVVTTETYQDVTQDTEGEGNNLFVGGDYNGETEGENDYKNN